MSLLLVMAGLLQHPVRSDDGSGSLAGWDAELRAGSEVIGGLVLVLQSDGVRVVRPVRLLERAVDPELAQTDWVRPFDRAPFSRAAAVQISQTRSPHPAPGLVGIVELRI